MIVNVRVRDCNIEVKQADRSAERAKIIWMLLIYNVQNFLQFPEGVFMMVRKTFLIPIVTCSTIQFDPRRSRGFA